MNRDIQRADGKLLCALDRAFVDAKQRAGSWLVCRPGCSECCMGLFPITTLDAERLRDALERLDRSEPERAESIKQRARRGIAVYGDQFSGCSRGGLLDENAEKLEAFLARHARRACPLLDPKAGLCELYEARPVSCRTYGPPVTIGDEKLPACRICFAGADPDEVERCRIAPDPDDLERQLLDEHGLGGRETLVALALTSPSCELVAKRPRSPGC